jgi:hypothetical protein
MGSPYDNYQDGLVEVIAHLNKRFGRLPTENEVYRVLWGSTREREKIWENRGLPEHLR